MNQTISPLSVEQILDLKEKRRWVREHYEPDTQAQYATIDGKLKLLDAILSNRWVSSTETVKLQALGVAFGDALEQELGMKWVSIHDEYGTDPALVVEATSIKLFPLTSISKRIENNQEVNIYELFEAACSTVRRLVSEGV